MHLGKKIRDLRFRRGLTVQQLAELSGLSKGFISQVENERTSPSLATLRDLARALNTSVAYLVVEDDSVPHIVRESDRLRGSNGAPIHVEVLTAQPRRNLEMLMTTIPPGFSTLAVSAMKRTPQKVAFVQGLSPVCAKDPIVIHPLLSSSPSSFLLPERVTLEGLESEWEQLNTPSAGF